MQSTSDCVPNRGLRTVTSKISLLVQKFFNSMITGYDDHNAGANHKLGEKVYVRSYPRVPVIYVRSRCRRKFETTLST